MADVYRKSLLEKLSSPDQLDKMIVIISPSFWAAVMGGAVIIAAAIIWSIVVRLPVNVGTSGIYMVRGGVHAVYAETSGTVEAVLVSEGTAVEKGEALVRLDDRQARESVSSLEERRTSVEAVAFDSEDDAAGADNKSLLDIKAQKLLSSIQLRADQALLEQRQRDMLAQEGRVQDKKAQLEAAQSAYLASIGGAPQAETNRRSVLYDMALTDYQTELSTLRSLDEAIVQLTAQIAAEQSQLDLRNASLRVQFDSTKSAILEQLDRELKEARRALEACTIRSTLSGTISGLNVVVGSVLQQTQPVCKVTSSRDEGDVIICYVSIAEGRRIAPGMRAVVYPSTVNRQEYGHMEATVTDVAEFVTSVEDMRNQLGDDTLVQYFTRNGPVLAVTCELRRDETTASGYWWSNRKGGTVEIAQGTLVTTDTVIEEKAPISMLIPLLKEKLTIRQVQTRD